MQTLFEWVGGYKDLLALLISLLALAVGLATTVIALVAARRQAQRDTYARMHEALVAPEVATGRRLLFLAHRNGEMPKLTNPDWDKINQALALYDTLGTYYQRRLVPRRLLMAAWHHPLRAIKPPAHAFVEERRRNGITQPWPMLAYLLREADAYTCRCPDPTIAPADRKDAQTSAGNGQAEPSSSSTGPVHEERDTAGADQRSTNAI